MLLFPVEERARLLALFSLLSPGKSYWLSMFPFRITLPPVKLPAARRAAPSRSAPHFSTFSSASVASPFPTSPPLLSRTCECLRFLTPGVDLPVVAPLSRPCPLPPVPPPNALPPPHSRANHPGAPEAHAQPPLVHPLHCDRQPQARVPVVPRHQAPPGARLRPHHDRRLHRERVPRLPAAHQPHAHPQRHVQAGGQEHVRSCWEEGYGSVY